MFDRDTKTNVRRERHLELDEICSSFEKAWHTDKRKGIEAFVAQVSDAMKPIVVRELVALECELRHESGEMPGRSAYQSRFCDFKDQAEAGFDDWIATSGRSESVTKDSLHPEKLGDYRIVRQIGRGGMGIVYEAIQESLDRKVAIKTLASHPLHVPKSAHRFRRESRAVARLHHTNIIHVYGSGVYDGIPYFAMQYIDGKSLDCEIKEAIEIRKSLLIGDDTKETPITHRLLGPFAYKNIAKIGLQVCSALQYAHEHGVLHRDIKPSNLLIDEKGTTWVSDFGLAKLRRHEDQTISGEIIGTMRYSPPETFGGTWSERGDVYSLGLTLYELLALQPAFPEEHHPNLINRITRGDAPKRLRRINPTIPRDLETIIIKAIAREPGARYKTAEELAKDLACFCSGQTISARPVSTTEKVVRWAIRKPVMASLVACIFAMVLIGFPFVTHMWLETKSALRTAEEESTKADVAQIEVLIANQVANVERVDALHAAYARSMQLAQKFMEEKQIADAGVLLEEWNQASANSRNLRDAPELNGWEWNFIRQQIDTSRMTLKGNLPHVWHVQISPDDKYIATVHAADHVDFQYDPRSEIIIWDAQSGQRLQTLKEPNGLFTGSAFSPNGTELTTIAVDLNEDNRIRGYLRTWSIENGELVQTTSLPGNYDHSLLTFFGRPTFAHIQYSSSGQHILISPSPVEVRDAKTHEAIWSAHGRQATIIGKEKLAYLDENNQLNVAQWKSNQVVLKRDFHQNTFDITPIHDFNLFSARIKNNLQIWRNTHTAREHKLRLVREFPLEKIYWGAIADSGNTVCCSDSGGRVLIHRLKDEKWYQKTFLGHALTVSHGDFSHNGKWLATASLDGTTKIWDLDRSVERKVHATEWGHDRISDFAFSPNGNRLNYIARNLTPDDEAEKLPNAGCFYYDKKPAKRFHADVTFSTQWPRTDFCFSPDGKFLLAPMAESHPPQSQRQPASSGQMGIWFVEDWSLIRTFDLPFLHTYSVAWNKNLQTVVVAGKNDKSELAIFDVRQMLNDLTQSNDLDFEKPAALFELDERHVTALAFDDNKLAVGRGQELMIIDLDNQENTPEDFTPQFRYQLGDLAEIKFMDFSPSGDRLAIAVKGRDVAQMYNLENGEREFEISAPRETCCIKFSPNGRRIALSGYDSMVYLCDSKTGYRLLNLGGTSHSPEMIPINSRVVFSSDGRKIATNTREGNLVVWEAEPMHIEKSDEQSSVVSTSNKSSDID